MNNELILLNKRFTDTLIEQTKTKPEETLKFELKKQMKSFSFNFPINLAEVGKWLAAVTSFQATNSVFHKTDENNSFSITTPGHWTSNDGEETINRLNVFLELRSQNDFELHLEELSEESLV